MKKRPGRWYDMAWKQHLLDGYIPRLHRVYRLHDWQWMTTEEWERS